MARTVRAFSPAGAPPLETLISVLERRLSLPKMDWPRAPSPTPRSAIDATIATRRRRRPRSASGSGPVSGCGSVGRTRRTGGGGGDSQCWCSSVVRGSVQSRSERRGRLWGSLLIGAHGRAVRSRFPKTSVAPSRRRREGVRRRDVVLGLGGTVAALGDGDHDVVARDDEHLVTRPGAFVADELDDAVGEGDE